MADNKVVPIRRVDSIQNMLCEAADAGLTECVIIGRRPDGFYTTWMSKSDDIVRMVGILRLGEADMLENMKLNSN